ncbi:hypothetical protein CLOM_g13557 [Closterium sp. NIES-68]|nr:hypothetical protein CLOM_g13557 [Closterium sp. NIES-68]
MGCIQSKPELQSRDNDRDGDSPASSRKERRGQSRRKERAKTVSIHGKPRKRDPAAAEAAGSSQKEEQAAASALSGGVADPTQSAPGDAGEERDGSLLGNSDEAEGAVVGAAAAPVVGDSLPAIASPRGKQRRKGQGGKAARKSRETMLTWM